MQKNFRELIYLATHFFQSGNCEKADQLASEALAINSRCAEALYLRGLVAGLQNRHSEAELFLRKAANIEKKNHYIFFNLAKSLDEQEKYDQSLKWHKKAIELNRSHDRAWLNYGNALFSLGDLDTAISAFDHAIAINDNLAEALNNKGICLYKKQFSVEALALHEHAIRLNPELAEFWNCRGLALRDLDRHEESFASYAKAIDLKPDYAEAWGNLGNVLSDLGRYDDAVRSYEQAVKLNPDADSVLGSLVHTQMKICNWTDLGMRCQDIARRLLAGKKVSDPFAVIGLFDDPQIQKHCAMLHAASEPIPANQLGAIVRGNTRGKIRIGYFSSDFRDHPVSQLIVELIERHDRMEFEIFAFSFGGDTADAMRSRLLNAFDNFVDVRNLSDLDIARLAREIEIDIAIDLGGYTQDSRPGIFANRAAPIQISYLGFPGTMGTDHIDYFIADRVTVNSDNVDFFSEKIIFLPNCFQANPSRREIGSMGLLRENLELPRTGFVFCCFNNLWKLTPEIFQSWSRILKSTENSCIWLQSSDSMTSRNLIREFKSDGIDASRVVFASRIPSLSDHLSRYRCADLFLDTFPYGAHTTASDALWTGLPVLTRSGRSFASRVASSLLSSLHLPELITQNSESYESLAIELAHNPERIAALKSRLVEVRDTSPLFNTPLLARQIETAFKIAFNRHQNKLPLDHIYVN